MNNRDDKKNGKEEGKDTAKKILDAVGDGLGAAGNAIDAAGGALPKPIALLGEVANIASEVIKHPSGNTAEKLVCGAGKALAQGVASAPLYGAAGAIGAARMPTPLTAGVGAAGGILAADPYIKKITEPVGDLADRACRSVFKAMRGSNQESKAEQHQQASSIITRQRAWDSSMNSFAPKMNLHSYFSTPFAYRSFSYYTNPYFQYYSSSSTPSSTSTYDYGRVQMAVQNAIRSEMNSLHPSLSSAYSKACAELGYGYVLSMGEFRSAVSCTSLISSYNAFNPYSSIRDVINFCREIGGVGSFVSIINDLINSKTHSEANDYIICFREDDKENQMNPSLIKQIANELKQGYFVHQTSPFFSLHINNRGFQYPVIHPAYQHGLIGEIIGFLDYWMKGYLNGGVFDAEFLRRWHLTENIDETTLRKNLIDLKKYCNDNKLNDLNYISLRQWLAQNSIKEAFNPKYLQPYMTSFRIIAYQEKIERDDNIIIPHPTFRVEYTIDMMPDYKSEMMAHYKEHGCYPPDYQQIRECYEIFCKKIQENLPKIPFCKTFFKLLYVMNSLSYLYATFKQMGKMPELSASPTVSEVPFPKSLPPIPVRYYRRLTMPVTFLDISKHLWKTAADINQFDQGIMQLFKQKSMVQDDLTFIPMLSSFIANILKEKLVPLVPTGTVIEINDDEVTRITHLSENFLLQNTYHYYSFLHITLNDWLEDRLHDSSKASQDRSLLEKIMYLETKLTARLNELTKRWETTKSLAKNEISSVLPKDLQSAVAKSFNNIEKMLLDQLNEEESETIKQNSEKYEQQINQECDQAIQMLKLKITELQTLRTNQLAEIQKSNNFIASAPPHLRNLPANVKIIQDVQASIANMNQHLVVIDENIANLGKKIAESPTIRNELISAKKKQINNDVQALSQVARIAIKNGTDDNIQTYYKDEAIRILKLSVENDCTKLKAFKNHIEHFSTFLNAIPELMNTILSKEYVHSIIGFNHAEIAKQTGESFRIIGGCGMELPSMTSQSLADAKSLRNLLDQAFKNQPNEAIVQVTFNHQKYLAYRMLVTELKLDLDKSIDAAHFSTLKNFQTPLDKSGATAAHYAALLLSEDKFDTILKANSLSAFTIKDRLGHLPLHGAAKMGNVSVVTKLLQAFPSQLDVCNHQGATPLVIAVQYGQLAVVNTLLSFKPNVNHQLSNGLFPLYISIQNNFPEITTSLLNYPGIMVNEKLDNFMTPLHLAIERELPQIALNLIGKGALFDINRKADGFTAWHLAAQKGQLSVLQAMILRKVNRHMALESNKTALHLAAEAGEMATCQYLLSQGLSPDVLTREKETPLMLAIQSGRIHIAEILANVTSVNLMNQSRQIASIVALRYHMPSIADILVNKGENPQLRDKFDYGYQYYLIRNGEYHRFFDLVDQKKIDLHAKYNDESLLCIAAKYGHFMIVEELLNRNVKWKSKTSLTLIDYAVIYDEIGYVRDQAVIKNGIIERAATLGSIKCLEFFLDESAKNNTLIKESVLIAGIESAQTDVVDLVLKHFPNVNLPLDSNQNTALHLAVKTGSREMVEFLIKRDSSLILRNLANETVFHLAIKYEDERILKRLFKLSTPKEWPHDIWQNNDTSSPAAIKKILNQFQRRKIVLNESVNKKTITTVSHELLSISLEEKEKLLLHINRQSFEEAIQLLEKSSSLMKLWQTNHGGDYIQKIFQNIHDYSSFTEELRKTLKIQGNLPEFLSFHTPRRLLNYLKNIKVDPARFLGKQNVLLSIVTAENEATACYRFNLLVEYFPQALPALLNDHCLPHTRAGQIVITRNWRKLFLLFAQFTRKYCDKNMLLNLHDAVTANHYESVNDLLNEFSGEDLLTELISDSPVNSRNEKGQTLLMIAASNGNVPMMELLLRYHACPRLLDREGNTALYYAIQAESDEAALVMLSHLPNKNAPNFLGERPLFFAAANGMLNVVRVLSDEASAHAVDHLGRNALHYAALKGHAHIIEYFVQKGFAIDQVESPENPKKMQQSQKRTALHLAAWMGQIDAVCKLISLGAKVNAEDVRGYTVVEYGVKSKRIDMLQLIQQIPTYHDQNHLTRLLHAAAECNHVEVLSELILNDVNLNAVNQIGDTVLHITARFDSGDAAKLLVKGNDCAVDITNQIGDTALHVAAKEGHVSIAETLLKANAAIDKKNKLSHTPLFIAAQKGHAGVVSTLLRYRADLTLTNDKGMTPLQVAQSNNQEDTVRLLRK